MEKAIEDVCKYYAQFSYPPKEMEIYMFLSEKISFQRFRNNLKNMCMSHRLVKQVFDKDERFQIIENESMFRSSSRKYERGKLYFDQVRSILKYLKIVPAIKFSLEEALEFIQKDEYVEVTPHFIRLRKVYLTENERKRNKII